VETGRHVLRLGVEREGVSWVPSAVKRNEPAPLLVLLHGAGGSARWAETQFENATSHGIIIVAPTSRGATWDGIGGRFGEDVGSVQRAMEFAAQRFTIDPARIAIGGFSDGASYALALGIANGNVFTHVLAFSPGFIPRAGERGKPRIFVSHGTQDTILPIDRTSRLIVPRLERNGYEVVYREFDGPHRVVPAIAQEAMGWFTAMARGAR
jgi:phospholipase/carboxylesterase